MKKFIFFARVYALTLALPLTLSAQDKPTVYPNYVVIGAFAFHDNAIEFTDEANKNTFTAKFEMNPNRNLYYVYVLTTHDREMAFSEALRLRTNTKYFDTWVYSGPLGKLDLAQSGSGPGEDLNPETGGQLNNVSGEQGQPVSTEGAVNPVLQTGEGALAVNSTDADPSLNAALIAVQPGASEDKNATKASRRKKRSKGATTGEDSKGADALNEGQNSGLTTAPDNENQDGALNSGAQTNLQATGQPGNIRSGQNAGQISQQGATTGQNNLASAQNSGQTTGVAELNNNQGTGQQGNVKSGQNTGQTSQQGSTTDKSAVASLQDSNQTTVAAGQNNKQATGQQATVKSGQNAGQTSQQGSTTDKTALASAQNPNQSTATTGQNNKQGTAQQGDVKSGQIAGQTSQQGSTTGKTTLASGQNSDQTTGTGGQNNKQATGQQATVKSGQNAGQTSQQGSTTDKTALASAQNPNQSTATAGQSNKQGTAQQGNVKSDQNAGKTSQQGSTTDKTTLAAGQNSDQSTGTAGQNSKPGTTQQGNVKSGQNAGQNLQQASITDKATVASAQNPNQTTGTAGQNNKQATGQQATDKSGQNALQPSQQGLTTTSTTLASGQNADQKKQGAVKDGIVQPGQNVAPAKNDHATSNPVAAATASRTSNTESSKTLTRESDKTLTDAGRKALVENRERQAALGPPPQRATTAPLTNEEVVGKNIYFHLFRGDNLDMVDGEVDAIDFEKSRRMATYQGNTAVKVIMPSGQTKQVSFVCQVFGYKKQQREFDPSSPPEDLYLDDKGNLVIPFELVRMQKGDIAIMYNVFFFKDAAVMRPESRYEVNNLLDLLAENPSYKIVIHGHTNGNATGKIIRMNTPGNFYSLAGTKQGFGSARELSEERAIVIRDFLVNSGIVADRMQVKAWGGKKPIHDKHSVRANENVRVEIEILQE